MVISAHKREKKVRSFHQWGGVFVATPLMIVGGLMLFGLAYDGYRLHQENIEQDRRARSIGAVALKAYETAGCDYDHENRNEGRVRFALDAVRRAIDVRNGEMLPLPAVSIPAGGTSGPIEAVFEDATGATLAKVTIRLGGVDDLSDRTVGRVRPCIPASAQAILPSPLVDDWEAGQPFQVSLIPSGFDWQTYLGANPDLVALSPSINTEEEAKRHFAKYGINQISSKPSRRIWKVRWREPHEFLGAEVTVRGLSSTIRRSVFARLFGADILPRSTSKVLVVRKNHPISRVWTRVLGGTGMDYAEAISVRPNGGILMVGSTYSALDGQTNWGGYDGFMSVFSHDGTKQGTRLLGGFSTDYIEAATTDPAGNYYVGGASWSSPGMFPESPDFAGINGGFLMKYNSSGVKQWVRSNRWVLYRGLAIGADGGIYAIGYSMVSLDGQAYAGAFDAMVTKFNAQGVVQWSRLVGGTQWDEAFAVTPSADGGVYMAGYVNFDGDTSTTYGHANHPGYRRAFVIKYSANGVQEWRQILQGSYHDEARALTTGTDGAVYLGGITRSSNFEGQTNSKPSGAGFVSKLGVDGTKQWTRLVGDSVYALAAGSDGGIYSAGQAGIHADIARFGSDGTREFIWTLGKAQDYGSAKTLAIGLDGSIFMGGSTTATTTFDGQQTRGEYDAFLSKLIVQGNTDLYIFELPVQQ